MSTFRDILKHTDQPIKFTVTVFYFIYVQYAFYAIILNPLVVPTYYQRFYVLNLMTDK